MAPLSLPDTQGLKCPTFRPPRQLLEQNKATLPEIYDWNGVHNPDHPLFVYDDDDEIRTITWSQAVRMIHRAARYIRDRSQLSSHDPFRLPVVGILASSDTITYLCTMIGIMRAGFTFFAISPRNSPEAVAHLLTKTETAFLLVSPESSTVTLAESASGIIQSTGGVSPKIDRMPVFEDLCAAVDDVSFDSYPTVAHDGESVAMIFHSSGS
ncbi:hypothetical protein EUX98_g4374 [Antrodiella citrinella]|uniref:AMP-dependent synthetase/ligase domain-containing protein n=1 Tax=Antrodiella citrinella TaxID=2447956 RepID=A0A4V3XIM8_9APHY|nr:hypothetical protein EUX98_g4374 [Antrodiella citrinella]